MKGTERVRPKFCRHCGLLYDGTCPHPVARSVHRTKIGSGNCPEARLHKGFVDIYAAREVVDHDSLRTEE